MAIAFSEFDTTPATIVADVKAKIILSSNWTNITANIVKATGADGGQMVVDLQKAAPVNTCLNMSVWRTHNGTVGVDEKNYFLPWKRAAITSAATDPVHCKVSAGPEHLYIETEGSRGGEPNAENALAGNDRQSFFIGTVKSYFDGSLDLTDAVVVVGNYTSLTVASQPNAFVSRNAADNASWVVAYLYTLSPASMNNYGDYVGNPVGIDGKTYLMPYVVSEIAAGIRGRINVGWYAGPTPETLSVPSDPGLTVGRRYTYAGVTYQLMAPTRIMGTTSGHGHQLAWSPASNIGSNIAVQGALVAIPVA